jgi:hypothetical protein
MGGRELFLTLLGMTDGLVAGFGGCGRAAAALLPAHAREHKGRE